MTPFFKFSLKGNFSKQRPFSTPVPLPGTARAGHWHWQPSRFKFKFKFTVTPVDSDESEHQPGHDLQGLGGGSPSPGLTRLGPPQDASDLRLGGWNPRAGPGPIMIYLSLRLTGRLSLRLAVDMPVIIWNLRLALYDIILYDDIISSCQLLDIILYHDDIIV